MINSSVLNTQIVNDEDTIFFSDSGLCISFEQSVELLNSDEGLCISFEQAVKSSDSGLCISFTQKIITTPSATSYLNRFGFKVRITIGNYIVPDNYICGVHTINRGENDTAILSFDLQPNFGPQDPYFYEGKTVTYDLVRNNGVYRMFTGKIDVPTFDLLLQRINLQCTDNREEAINSQLTYFKTNIGYYNAAIQGEAVSVYDEVIKRLSTVPYSLEVNAFGYMTYTPWAARALPDFVFEDPDVFYRKPRVIFSSRKKITNQVNISFQYRFPRLHYGETHYTWTAPYSICQFLTKGYTMTPRDMIQQAAQAAGWKINTRIGFTDFFSDGTYNCGPHLQLPFTNTETTYKTVPLTKTDSTGVSTNVLDAAGKQVYTGAPTVATDHSLEYCLGAGWTASTHWSQIVTQQYNL